MCVCGCGACDCDCDDIVLGVVNVVVVGTWGMLMVVVMLRGGDGA